MSRLHRLAPKVSLIAAFATFFLSPQTATAKNDGADNAKPREYCSSCGGGSGTFLIPDSPGGESDESFVSFTEGNVGEDYHIAQVRSAFGATMDFTLIYNSYNADGNRASLDTMVGYGWTHSYNDFLFSQGRDMFRMKGDGRIIRYALSAGGTYQTSPGYFQTLVKNPDGSFDVTDKYQTRYHYESIPNTPFLVAGPVLRLTREIDRNGNETDLTYVNGDLISVTDTYNRSFTFGYYPDHHLKSITTPAGDKTKIMYDSSGSLLSAITDPTQHSRTYTYNFLFQMISKVDRDGRQFTITYQHNLPYSELDGDGHPFYTLTNTSNWATDPIQLAENFMRVYIPSITSKTDGRGNVWQYFYNSDGHVTKVVAPDHATTIYTYDPATLEVASITNPNGNTTSFVYDSEGNLTQRIDPAPFNNYVTTYTYDSTFNQMLSMTDPQHRITVYRIDSHGNRLSETDPLLKTQSWTYDTHGNVLTFTDKDNHPPTDYTYDAYGNLMESDQPLMDVTMYTHDIMGDMTSMTDANHHETKYQFDALYRLILRTDALDGMKQYFYDGEGDLKEVIDENDHPTSYQYDLRRRLVTETDALRHITTYTYDGNNNRLSMTDRDGHPTKYGYDVQNRLTSTTDALNDTASRTYDPVGNLLSETDMNGHTTTYKYDELNRRKKRTDAENEVTLWDYDLTGLPGCPTPPGPCSGPTLGSDKVTKQTDGNGKVIYYAYDGLDRLIIEVHKQNGTAYDIVPAVDAVTYFFYDSNSNRTQMTEPDGNITTYAYDELNRKRQMIQVQTNDKTTWTYDRVGNILTITWPNLNVTTYTYDELNRRKTEDDSDGHVSTWIYDAVGNVLSQTDGDNHPTSFTYDPLNRRMTMTDALGKITHYFYDFVGNLLEVIDRDDNPTKYSYDAINRRMTMTDAQLPPAITKYQYDPVGNLTGIIDANDHTTTFAYDKVNRKVSETYPDPPPHNTVTWTYDEVGNVISRTDQKAQTTHYTYSDLYFLTTRAYPSGTDTFTYDLSGRVLTANTNRGIGWNETFAYDGANRLIQSVQNGRPPITYVYNIPGRMRTLTYPGGRAIVEQKDFRDSRLVSINDGGSTPIVQYAYDFANNVLTRGFRNGTVATSNYNLNNWVCSINHTSGANLIVGFTYAYDNEGNKFYEQKLHETNDSEAYNYDPVYRLIDYQAGMLASSPPPNCPISPVGVPMPITQTSYKLDPLGNWNSKDTDGIVQTRMHSPSNEITKIDTTQILSDYDGNTSDDGSKLYSYDEENRLVQVAAKGSGNVLGQYQYDAFWRRVSKIDNFGVQTLYYYDGWRTIEEQSSPGVTLATYVFGNYIDEALTMDSGGATYYFHQNALWSVFALTDSNGKGVEGYQYDAYGYQTLVLPGPDGILDFDSDDVYLPGAKSSYGNPFLFTGQRYDPEIGLLYYKNRHYADSLGRFLSRDPAGFSGSANLYEYVNGRPTARMDPSGLRPCRSWCYYWLDCMATFRVFPNFGCNKWDILSAIESVGKTWWASSPLSPAQLVQRGAGSWGLYASTLTQGGLEGAGTLSGAGAVAGGALAAAEIGVGVYGSAWLGLATGCAARATAQEAYDYLWGCGTPPVVPPPSSTSGTLILQTPALAGECPDCCNKCCGQANDRTKKGKHWTADTGCDCWLSGTKQAYPVSAKRGEGHLLDCVCHNWDTIGVNVYDDDYEKSVGQGVVKR